MKMKERRWKTTFKILTVTMILLLVACVGVPAYSESTSYSKEVVFGALLDLTGDWSSLGESSQVVLNIAIKDIQSYLSRVQSGLRIKLIVEDTEGDPLVAVEKLKNLTEQGVRVFIGPQSSAEVKAVKEYADKNGILVISQGSTAHSLAFPQDNVFRFCPDDVSEGQVMSTLMWEDGVRVVVPMWRDDAGNAGLYVAIKGSFEALGGTVLDGVRYSPTTKDFSKKIASLSSQVSEAITQHGANATAVYLAAFGEVVQIFNQTSTSSHLSRIRWYGGNGITLSSSLVNNPPAAQFAIKSDFISPIFGLDKSAQDKWEPISKQISSKIGRDVDAFTLAAYDALWVATLACLTVGDANNSSALREAFIETANFYYGTTGWTVLNNAGDRKFANYDFWMVQGDEGVFRWKHIAQ
ncbi:penicillin-binding protein activator [Patescibacteria group bacterium]|nr:penicillin-binding protein activator [Patescibacteria group bacterium]